MKHIIALILFALTSPVFAVGISIGGSGGDLTSFFQSDEDDTTTAIRSIWKLVKSGKSALKGYQDLTPEQEYYLGRAAAARIFGSNKAINDEQLHYYLNSLTNYLAYFSSRPETYAGYRVQVIDSDELLAYSTPGGFIILSDQLVASCENEDQLAGVIAHEIAHISLQHGLAAIKSSHLQEAGQLLSSAILDTDLSYARQATLLKQSFGGSVDDIVVQLLNSGYSKSQESDADEAAVLMLNRAGYNPLALEKFLAKTIENEKPATDDFFNTEGDIDIKNAFTQTHPGSDDRISKIRRQVKDENIREMGEPASRTTRFNNNVVSKLR